MRSRCRFSRLLEERDRQALKASKIQRQLSGYLGLEPRLTSGSIQGSGVDPQTQIAGAGVIGPASAEKNCKNAHLTAKQQAICSRSPPVLQAVSAGARLAIEECQHQFRSARWNCSVSPENPENVFGGVTLVNSREAAFIYAVSAAGVAYSVTRACSRGELTDCSCDNRVRTRHQNNWQWGGCSETNWDSLKECKYDCRA
ncbi:PREDICTED: protein Wnt-4a-like [Wasmannia auropunctata]|uniref:protein Wnt-4a-like n=1 Tax=Wasmannia auropunctata TaxID=64793 RepID=UPI0005F0AD1A|nr:PREDICTED: protein Wnt-4a-like [Wasmannia auropunctata]